MNLEITGIPFQTFMGEVKRLSAKVPIVDYLLDRSSDAALDDERILAEMLPNVNQPVVETTYTLKDGTTLDAKQSEALDEAIGAARDEEEARYEALSDAQKAQLAALDAALEAAVRTGQGAAIDAALSAIKDAGREAGFDDDDLTIQSKSSTMSWYQNPSRRMRITSWMPDNTPPG